MFGEAGAGDLVPLPLAAVLTVVVTLVTQAIKATPLRTGILGVRVFLIAAAARPFHTLQAGATGAVRIAKEVDILVSDSFGGPSISRSSSTKVAILLVRTIPALRVLIMTGVRGCRGAHDAAGPAHLDLVDVGVAPPRVAGSGRGGLIYVSGAAPARRSQLV